jgi:hypothetical protein
MSLTAAFSRNARSAARVGVAQVDLVLPVHELVVEGEDLESELRQSFGDLPHDAAGIRPRTDRVDHARLVDVAPDAVFRGGIGPQQEELELRTDDRVQACCPQVLNGPAHGPARVRDGGAAFGRLEIRQAARHSRLPRQRRHGRHVGAGDEVRIALVAADDGRVAQIGAHHGRAEAKTALEDVVKLRDRHLLAAGDAVEIGVGHPDQPDRRAGGELGDRLGPGVGAHGA